jgi:hypothetical protein
MDPILSILLHSFFICLSTWVAFGKTFRPANWFSFWVNIIAVGINTVGLIVNIARLI